MNSSVKPESRAIEIIGMSFGIFAVSSWILKLLLRVKDLLEVRIILDLILFLR